MEKNNTKKPPLEQPELPNIPPKPDVFKPYPRVLTVHTIKDAKGKKPDKIKVIPPSESQDYEIYDLATKLEKILQRLSQLNYYVSQKTIAQIGDTFQNFNQPLSKAE